MIKTAATPVTTTAKDNPIRRVRRQRRPAGIEKDWNVRTGQLSAYGEKFTAGQMLLSAELDGQMPGELWSALTDRREVIDVQKEAAPEINRKRLPVNCWDWPVD